MKDALGLAWDMLVLFTFAAALFAVYELGETVCRHSVWCQ